MHLLLRMNVMLDFLCMGPVKLPGARNKRKLQNEKNHAHSGFEPQSSSQIHHLIHLARTQLMPMHNLKPINAFMKYDL